jgi:ribosome-binding ATPase YchF (GTP1/OBG family)
VTCACSRFGLEAQCSPNYGSCIDGQRSVPIELIDVAGLVPGAHLGKGLGNKFLDDLRKADALIHVVDVSGTTDAEGEFQLLRVLERLSLNFSSHVQERRREGTIQAMILFG